MTDITGIQPNPPAAPLARATPPGLARNLAVDVDLPWLTVQLLQRAWDVPLVPAFAVAAIFPAVSILASWRRHRRPEFIGLAVLVAIITGIAIALFTNDARFAVLKAAPAFGLFGVACLCSLRWRRPLMFFVGREFNAGGDPRKAAAWDGAQRAADLYTVRGEGVCRQSTTGGVVAGNSSSPDARCRQCPRYRHSDSGGPGLRWAPMGPASNLPPRRRDWSIAHFLDQFADPIEGC